MKNQKVLTININWIVTQVTQEELNNYTQPCDYYIIK